MNDYIKRRAAFYTLTAIIDARNGEIYPHHQSVKRVFNDEDMIVTAELTDGSKCLACDLDFDTLNDIVNEYTTVSPKGMTSFIH